jgi:DNA-binding LytR/AlgR family response regulator
MSEAAPIRVLIADDEPRARQFLEKLLSEHEDVDVVGAARGGIESLQMAQTLTPEAAFLDIHMPDLSGLEVARQLSRSDRAPLVVFVTAYDRYAVEAFEVAALDYVLVLARAEGREYLVDYTLQELEQRLPEGSFVRVHRVALVNMNAIESYGGEDGVLVLKLKDGTRVEASERRAAEVRRKLK